MRLVRSIYHILLGSVFLQGVLRNTRVLIAAQQTYASSPQASSLPCAAPSGTVFQVEADIPSQRAALETLFNEVLAQSAKVAMLQGKTLTE